MWLSGQQVWTPGPGALPPTAQAWGCRPARGPVPLHTPRTIAGTSCQDRGLTGRRAAPRPSCARLPGGPIHTHFLARP